MTPVATTACWIEFRWECDAVRFRQAGGGHKTIEEIFCISIKAGGRRKIPEGQNRECKAEKCVTFVSSSPYGLNRWKCLSSSLVIERNWGEGEVGEDEAMERAYPNLESGHDEKDCLPPHQLRE